MGFLEGNNSKLEDLSGASIPVSIVGYRLAEDTVIDTSDIEFEAQLAKKKEKFEHEPISNIRYFGVF